MNLNSHEIRRSNIKSLFIDVVFGVVTHVAQTAFCFLGGERLHFRPSVCSVA